MFINFTSQMEQKIVLIKNKKKSGCERKWEENIREGQWWVKYTYTTIFGEKISEKGEKFENNINIS